ncbi:MAG: hypothetical protein ACYC20_02465 [Sulfurovum sp.]
MRRYFNKIMKHQGLNATAIALNIKDEHVDFTFSSVGSSKVTQMMLEKEFASKALPYCTQLNACASRKGRVDFIEVVEGQVYGYCLDDEAQALFEKPEFLDEHIIFVAKIMLIANRWFNARIDVDMIPVLIVEKELKKWTILEKNLKI